MLVAIGFLIAFLWSIKSGQYSDTYTPSVRILFEDENSKKESQSKTEKKNKEENKLDK